VTFLCLGEVGKKLQSGKVAQLDSRKLVKCGDQHGRCLASQPPLTACLLAIMATMLPVFVTLDEVQPGWLGAREAAK
jgi:hypothetical protein